VEQAALITVTLLVFTLVLADFFDAMGTMTGLAKEADLIDMDGQLPNVGKALFVRGSRVQPEGSARRARTRCSSNRRPVSRRVRGPGWLVVVGALLMSQVKEIDFSDFSIALPAFLTIVVMPFTYSIADGIGAGSISYVVIRAATGKAKQVHPDVGDRGGLYRVFRRRPDTSRPQVARWSVKAS
jgi:AGZA family xanthine/uracil permease-like MFS transporter